MIIGYTYNENDTNYDDVDDDDDDNDDDDDSTTTNSNDHDYNNDNNDSENDNDEINNHKKRTRFHASHCKMDGVLKPKLSDFIDRVRILMATMSCQFCMKCLFKEAWHVKHYPFSMQMQV